MSYADYEFYSTVYLGNEIEEVDFPKLSLRASSYIDYLTMGKAEKAPDDQAVKLACCAIAEQYQLIDRARGLTLNGLSRSGGAELQSQSVGSWSKTYRSAGESAQSAMSALSAAQAELYKIATAYLSGTGLLYRGGRCVL